LSDWLDQFGAQTSQAIRDALVSGMATGMNPRAIAQGLHGVVDVAGTRLEATARTAILGSYRSAAIANYAENQDVLKPEWEWLCAKSARTCAACLALDGTKHKISDGFQKSHVNCRCTSLPLLKDGPAIERETGEEWLAKQGAATQDRILGKAGGAQYRAGKVELGDFVVLDRDKRWGDSYRKGSFKDAQRSAVGRTVAPRRETKPEPAAKPVVPMIKTPEEMIAYFDSIGVKATFETKNAPIWNVTARAYADQIAAGRPIPAVLKFLSKQSKTAVAAYTRHLDAKTGALVREEMQVYQRNPFWKDAALAKRQEESGWWSSGDPDGVIVHEFGHYEHFQRIRTDKFNYTFEYNGVARSKRLSPPERQIASKVSKYGASDAFEFIAETFTGLRKGKTYDDDVMALYRQFGGPDV
jgi:SPP1 gp7 family putative phage head morphogenesis protein